jgi:hypothetical protein
MSCGRIIERGPRCIGCTKAWDRARRPSTSQRGYGSSWQRYARERIAEVGYCQAQPCPYPDAGTQRNPLTVDHATLGLVLCRRCNSAKQHADRMAGGTRRT